MIFGRFREGVSMRFCYRRLRTFGFNTAGGVVIISIQKWPLFTDIRLVKN